MMSAVMARLTPPRPSHSQNVERHDRFTNEGKQPAVISPKYESQTSETSSDPQEKPLDDSLSRSNGRSRMHSLSALVTPGSSPVLENSGNLARDHLSIERTWLSYLRTGLSMTWAGVGTSYDSNSVVSWRLYDEYDSCRTVFRAGHSGSHKLAPT